MYMPHGGQDEVDCITELKLGNIIMEEVKKSCAEDFLIGGDRNI